MKRMNENRNLISKRQRRILRQLNREIQAKKERRASARQTIAAVLIAIVVVIGLMVLAIAAEIRAAEDAQAAVLRDHRIRPERLAQYQDQEDTGLQAEDPYIVEALPAAAPADGEPPEAIEIVTMDRIAAEAPAESWESLGTWKLTAYCPLECCNGEGRAWTTASGAPMVIGDTVATARLPFGTKLMIRGHVYTVTDRGVPYGTVDILHESNRAAYDFGVQYAEVFILR